MKAVTLIGQRKSSHQPYNIDQLNTVAFQSRYLDIQETYPSQNNYQNNYKYNNMQEF